MIAVGTHVLVHARCCCPRATSTGRYSSLRCSRPASPGRGCTARIAAPCLQHGVRELRTADRDFGRFALLRTVNPLVAAG